MPHGRQGAKGRDGERNEAVPYDLVMFLGGLELIEEKTLTGRKIIGILLMYLHHALHNTYKWIELIVQAGSILLLHLLNSLCLRKSLSDQKSYLILPYIESFYCLV